LGVTACTFSGPWSATLLWHARVLLRRFLRQRYFSAKLTRKLCGERTLAGVAYVAQEKTSQSATSSSNKPTKVCKNRFGARDLDGNSGFRQVNSI
jgi:hypothetical protein